MNLLSHSSSPYLQQHRDQPIEWYPWGKEALELARKDDRPILVSIGYSTCHWCHVMSSESFTDKDVADYMNFHFVNIKIDREERPDLDGYFMDVCQKLTGRGGSRYFLHLISNLFLLGIISLRNPVAGRCRGFRRCAL